MGAQHTRRVVVDPPEAAADRVAHPLHGLAGGVARLAEAFAEMHDRPAAALGGVVHQEDDQRDGRDEREAHAFDGPQRVRVLWLAAGDLQAAPLTSAVLDLHWHVNLHFIGCRVVRCLVVRCLIDRRSGGGGVLFFLQLSRQCLVSVL